MSRDDRLHWDRKWDADRTQRDASRLLVDHRSRLTGGVALDIACGIGQNAVWLARHGYSVLGVDVSLSALRRAFEHAAAAGAGQRSLFAQVDLDHWAPPPCSADLICVFRFLDRSLIPDIRAALRPGGLIFYATRHAGLLARRPQATADYLLERGELRLLFRPWTVLFAGEDEENAALVARKPR